MPTKPELPTSDKPLPLLARDFAINMVDMATENEEFKDAIKVLLDDSRFSGEKTVQKVRNILIVGAGATVDVNTNIPSAYGVVQGLYKKYVKDERLLQIFADLKEQENEMHPGSTVTSFEFLLKSLETMLFGQNLRQELRRELGYKHLTSKFYEIIGHMFKHRLIDVIINFNFDEILDNIIDDEMGSGEYYKILLNGHCPDNFKDLYRENKLSLPVYIKPHGTVSHAGSLKFTYEHYRNGNVSIKGLISDLLSDAHEPPGTTLPLNIICAGYSFSDNDLHKLLRPALKNEKKQVQFYVFDNAPEKEYFEKSEFTKFIKPRATYFQTQNNLGETFHELWNQTVSQFKPEFSPKYPKGIERHLIIAHLFHKSSAPAPIKAMLKEGEDNDGKNKKRYIKYLHQRIYVEIAIIIAKSPGLIHINQFRDGRLKKYISLLHEQTRDEEEDLSLHHYNISLSHFIDNFSGVKPYMEVMKDTYELQPIIFNDITKRVKIDFLVEKLLKKLNIKDVNKEELIKLFSKMAENTLCIVNSDIKEFHLSPFKNLSRANLLYSDIRWLLKFRNLFVKETDWNVVLAISERGDILEDNDYMTLLKKKKAIVWSILADHSLDRDVTSPAHKKQKDYPGLRCRIKYLPWESHNKHIYLFLHVRPNEPIICRHGVYYVRRLLSDVVNPVKVDEENAEILFDYFCSYWIKANAYSHFGLEDLKKSKKEYHEGRLEIEKLLYEDVDADGNLPDLPLESSIPQIIKNYREVEQNSTRADVSKEKC